MSKASPPPTETVEYSTYQGVCGSQTLTFYQMYLNGIWDECKRTLEEAEAAYPRSRYRWVLVDQS